MREEIRPSQLFVPGLAGLYSGIAGLAYPLVRVVTGLFLMPHGAQKLFGWFGGNIEGSAAFFGQIGLEPALPLAYLVGVIEFVGGLFLVIGFLTRPVAAAVFIQMMVASWLVHLPNGYFWSNGGYEYPLLWGLLAVAIFMRGGGRLSLDSGIGREF